ncbi:MAG: DUF4097 family beta strand repeat-containing protein [Acidobacteriota bacterium]
MLGIVLAPSATLACWEDSRFQESRTLEQSFTQSTGLAVETVLGSITIKAHDADTIDLVYRETLRARDRVALERAKNEVDLFVERRGEWLELGVDSPYRDREGNIDYNHRLDYCILADFELRVPRRLDLDVHTVTEGEIVIEGVDGDFIVEHVAGDITLIGVAGDQGEVATVSGDIHVGFTRNPKTNWSFRTVSGDVDVRLQPGLDAFFDITTQFGEVFTSYEVSERIVSAQPVVERKGGRTLVRAGSGYRVQVGDGGAELAFETLSGTIYVHDRDAR